MCSESAAVSRDLPMPGSPEISTTRPSPLFACCQRRISSSTSSSRPTSGVAPERNASNRLNIPLSPMTRHAGCGSAKPASACGPRSARSNSPPICRRVASAMTSVFGAAKRLQPGGEVRGLADDPALLRGALADQVADHGEPGGDAEPNAQILVAPVIGRPPRSPRARRAPPARHRPHALADSRNRSAPRRPYIWRQSHRSGRPSRRRRGGSRRSARANPPGHDGSRAPSSRPGRRTSPSAAGVRHRREQVNAASRRRQSPLAVDSRGAERGDGVEQPPAMPDQVTPRSFRSSIVRLGRTVASISFARNAGSYCSSPSLRNHSATSIAVTR